MAEHWQKTRFETASGLTLVADMAGPENGQPVILLHGGGQTRHSWSKALSELAAAGYKVISPDLRGHGESQWCPEGRYTLDDYMVDLGLIMGTLVSSPILVGASLGGVVSLVGLGEQQLPPARALVLVDVVPRMETLGLREVIDFMSANTGGFVSIDAAAHAVGQYLPHRPRSSSRDGLLKNLRQRSNGRYYWHWAPRFTVTQARPMTLKPWRSEWKPPRG